VSPTPRAAWLLGGVAAGALVLPLELAIIAGIVVTVVTAYDAAAARASSASLSRRAPTWLARGVPGEMHLDLDSSPARVRLRQPVPPDLHLDPSEADGQLRATVVARRRGRHRLPPAAARVEGPLGLGCVYRSLGEATEVLVLPDLPSAWRLAHAVRRGRFGAEGRNRRGPLGLGTDFESIRDYLPDDDIRQVNWRATARLGRPMSNQYRIEQDQDVLCVVDAGRLMGAPLGDVTRLDAAVDAVAALAFVAQELGDRCGAVAFDDHGLRRVAPRRKGAHGIVRALFDLEPSGADSDYELAFRTVSRTKRSFVVVFTDLLDEGAARILLDAVPLLAAHHSVVVASASDIDLDRMVADTPQDPRDVYAAAVALDALEARARVGARLARAGALTVEAPPARLGAACVASYLRAKERVRL
jgi:uncharacterized protein (DUF58 family)